MKQIIEFLLNCDDEYEVSQTLKFCGIRFRGSYVDLISNLLNNIKLQQLEIKRLNKKIKEKEVEII